METLFLVGLAILAATVMAAVAFTWFLVRAVLWVLFFPLMILKAVFGLVFGLIFGALGMVVGLTVMLLVGGVGLLALLAVVAIPILPFLLIAGLIWLAIKGTTALAAA